MSIRTIVTGGFGNGTFNGSISDVVTHGYLSDVAVAAPPAAVVAAPEVVGGWRPIPLPQFVKPAPIELFIQPTILAVWGSVLFELTTLTFLEVMAVVEMSVAKPLAVTPVVARMGGTMPVFDKAWADGDWFSRALTATLDREREAEEVRLLGLL